MRNLLKIYTRCTTLLYQFSKITWTIHSWLTHLNKNNSKFTEYLINNIFYLLLCQVQIFIVLILNAIFYCFPKLVIVFKNLWALDHHIKCHLLFTYIMSFALEIGEIILFINRLHHFRLAFLIHSNNLFILQHFTD